MDINRLLYPLDALLQPPHGLEVDFGSPPGAEALVPADSISWRVFGNPVTLFVGGVAAVILELAEPSVRAGVWDHSSFRSDPMQRLRRTGMAAMITVYAPRTEAEVMIARVNAMHAKVRGTLPDGTAYHASDTRLLDWVQATASFGFVEAYSRFAAPLSSDEKSRAFAEAVPAAELYGATGAPRSVEQWEQMLARTLPGLEPSGTLAEFLGIMRNAPILPLPLRPVQSLLVAAAITILPARVRRQLHLDHAGLRLGGETLVAAMSQTATVLLPSSAPQVQARQRMRVGRRRDYGGTQPHYASSQRERI
jgi:uncharacterized protein (DUF2236 family)